MMRKSVFRTSLILLVLLSLGLSACSSKTAPTLPPLGDALPADSRLPKFSHVFLVILENEDYSNIIANPEMPNFNRWASQYTVLTQYYAVSHPSLPNYLALMAGDTFGVTNDCINCFQKATSLPDLLEKNNLTWKTYQEDMPSPCYVGNHGRYVQKHNPFIYFDDIRTDKTRCDRSVVPLSDLTKDIENHQLPNFAFIMPNICNSGHDCGMATADGWLGKTIQPILDSPDFDENSLLVITFDEGKSSEPCCGLKSTGGRVATLLISPSVQKIFQDNTPYTHYSLLKTISASWGLQLLGNASSKDTSLILAPFEK